MGKLAKWAKDNSEWLRIANGEKVIVKYLGYKIVSSRFEEDQETIRYVFDVDGIEKKFESRAFSLAETFDGIKEGTVVSLTRNGEGGATKYEVGVVVSGEEVDPEEVEIEKKK